MIPPRLFLAFLSLAILSSASADWTLRFDQNLDFDILNPSPVNAWKFTPEKTLRFDPRLVPPPKVPSANKAAPQGNVAPPPPPEGTLRFAQSLQLKKLTFKLLPVDGEVPPNVQRTLSFAEGGGTSYSFLFDNKDVVFTMRVPNKPVVQRVTPMPDTFAKGGTLAFVQENGEMVATNEGTEIARFPAPQEPVWVVFKSISLPVEFSEILFEGEMWPSPRNRQSFPLSTIKPKPLPNKIHGYQGPANMVFKFPEMGNISDYDSERDYYDFQTSKAGPNYFEGPTNVVVDPGFEMGGEQALTWKSIGEAPEYLTAPEVTGTGDQGFDETARHGGKRSFRLANTKETFGVMGNRFLVDWTRPYEFSGWVKGEKATGKTYLEITWHSAAGKLISLNNVSFVNEGNGVARGGVVKSGESRSEEVSGTFDWKKLVVRAEPPKGAVMAEFHLRSDDNSGTVWFDDLECDGYGALETEVMVSAGGYPTKSYKHAVVVSKTPLKQLDFAIAKKEGGKPFFEGKLKDLGHKKMLNRYSYLAEFSPMQEAGEYILSAKRPDGQEQRSLPFSVSKDGYLNIARLAAFYFYFSRCGMEIPGYHEACHLDDGIVDGDCFNEGEQFTGYRDLVGGWHDAGDWGKFHSRMINPVYSLATAALLEPPKWKNPSDDMPALTAEAAWGADYLVKISRGDGLFLGHLYGGLWGGAPMAEPSVETDGIKNTVDGSRKGGGYIPHYIFTTPSLALAQAALAVRPFDKQRAETYLKVAREAYDGQTAFWKKAVKPDTEDWKKLVMEPKALWAAVALYRATGEERFAKEADEWLLSVLPLLEKGVQKTGQFFWAEPPKPNNFPYAYIEGVMDYVETFPKSPHVERAKTAVIKELDERILPATSFRNNPFGVMENLTSENLWYYPEAIYTTELYPKTAEVLAWGAELFDRPEWRDAADRNLQWIVGNNHLQASYMAGIGERQQPGWIGLAHTPGLRHGILPGAITKGIVWGEGKFDTKWSERSRYPLLLCYFGEPRGFGGFTIHDGVGFYTHGSANEVWEQFNGSVVLSAVRLQMARMPEAKDISLPPLPMGSANLVENGGFEGKTVPGSEVNAKRPGWRMISKELPDAWDITTDQAGEIELVTDAAGARSGTKYLRVAKKDDNRSAQIVIGRSGKGTFKVKPGETYWLRLWVKGRGRVRVFAHEQNATAHLFSRPLAEFLLTQQWQPVDIEYAVPEKTINAKEGGKPEDFDRFRIAFDLLPQGEMLLDDVMLRRSPDIKVPKATVLR